MDNFTDERDFKILDADKYTFFVLKKILGFKNELLLTDHKRLVICFSQNPFPVWIWTSDDATEEDMETAYKLSDGHGFLNGSHRINLKYTLAEYFIERAASENKSLSILTNMFAYDCQKLISPDLLSKTDGNISKCKPGDEEELACFMDGMHNEINCDKKTKEEYLNDAVTSIAEGNAYFWKNAHGKNVASCEWKPNDDMASISLVFTRPEYRRKHYAENLVYQVTKIAADSGFIPMLYTDADYVASNACYEKIGYVLRGKLCTIGRTGS